MLCVLKRTASLRRFFWAPPPQHMFKLMGKEITAILSAQTILIWTYACINWIYIFMGETSGPGITMPP